ncbi:MAG: UDP-galactopyranose mutase [Candidatus Lokiarchaeota archaeon]|nr:UDP-galactopyranose mutase [Candidatus Lokiarchaeota archaeon]
MIRVKVKKESIPDILTFSRGILAIIILLFIPFGLVIPYIFTIIYITSWITDVFDGWAARKLKIKGKLADWDFIFDSLLQWSAMTYFAFIGILPWIIYWILTGLCIVLSLILKNKAMVALFGTAGQAIFLFFMFFYYLDLFITLCGFWLSLFILNFTRFKGRLNEFKEDVSEIGEKMDLKLKFKKYDFLIVGAGFSGAVLAQKLASELNKKILIIDKREHIGGNCYDFYNENGVLVHKYGPHYFRTNSNRLFEYLSQFTQWHKYEYKIRSCYKGELYPFPPNRDTLNQFYNINLQNEEEAKEFLAKKRIKIPNPKNTKELFISKVGYELYRAFFKNYTKKHWGINPEKLSPLVAARIPVRTNTDDRYFTDKYQVMPLNGYHKLFENILNHKNITIRLNIDFQEIQDSVKYNFLIYTGPIDEFFEFKYGKLPYRSLIFEFLNYDKEFYQDWVQINYPNKYKFTRIVEIKHATGQKIGTTTTVKEFPNGNGKPFYPIPSEKNHRLYKKYKKDADQLKNIIFIGRLAEYKYLNMDQVIENALETAKKIIESHKNKKN